MTCELDYKKERLWEKSYLKKKCLEVGVEDQYDLYQIRIRINYVGVFFLLHLVCTSLHSILLLTTCDNKSLIYIDVSFYLAAGVVIILVMIPNFNEELVTKHIWVMYLTSVIAVVILVSVDLLLNLYHYYKDDWITGSFYDTYIILMVYMFFPIPHIKGPLALGSCVSVVYISYFIYYLASKYRYEISNAHDFNYMSADISHHICLNLMGAFFRTMRDIVVRSSFLDRHQYVMEDIWLRNARAKEKVFLHSILPPQIAKPIQEDIRDRIKIFERRRDVPLFFKKDRIMALQIHPEVSILYADVVNYTHLTTTLTVKNLVTLLHDLYARFDVAAFRYSVQRIKFLGDCYYCVSGLTMPDPDHAKCCVELGLCMIAQIEEVAKQREVDINIRVGVHSGCLFAGVLGAAKLQFDIWGTDVVIANHLEATGVPGHIHISERTLNTIVDHTYKVFPGTQAARIDAYLQKNGIHTYLIAPVVGDLPRTSVINFQQEESVIFSINDMEENKVWQEMHNEFNKMPVGPLRLVDGIRDFCSWSKKPRNRPKEKDDARSAIGVHLLNFHDPRLEYNYMRQPDYMLKYSILLAWCIGFSLVYIQVVYHTATHEHRYYASAFVMLYLSILLFITWFKKICIWRYSDGFHHRYNRVSCLLFRLAENIQCSLVKRMIIYILTIIGYFWILFVMMYDCEKTEFEVLLIESKIYLYEPDLNMCFHPWVVTNMLCLIIGMSLIFTRIPFIMKIAVTMLETITYMIIVFCQFEFIVHHSLTTNPFFVAEYAHGILLIIVFMSLCLMERQTEFNNKMNYLWRVELKKKQRDGRIADQSITILLHNILPSHVVNVYLTTLANHQLYYEDYEMVAVMFASLKNFQLDLPNLRVLNEIISEFDRILSFYREDYLVEKIKIVGCTYMAACGLDLRHESLDSQRDTHTSVIQEVLQARRSLARFHKKNFGVNNEEVVFVLTSFALDLMRTLWTCNNNYKSIPVDRTMFDADMSVGISCGEVMAGVVGASQVHYDIWGNAVNMASRMDSTGIAGHIQVTDETAVILRRCGLVCEFRGMTYVKGRGILPTYFVGIDENYDFRYCRESVWFSGQSSETSSDDNRVNISEHTYN